MKVAVMTALALVLAVPAMAQDGARTGMFDRMDKDGSGTISLAEIEQAQAVMAERSGREPRLPAAQLLERLDKDGSGAIDAQEWGAMAERMGDRGGERSDRDPVQMAGRAFDRMDVNADGVLSKEEFIQGAAKMREMRKKHQNRETQ